MIKIFKKAPQYESNYFLIQVFKIDAFLNYNYTFYSALVVLKKGFHRQS